MTKIKIILFLGLIVGISSTAFAQYITIDENRTAEQLVNDILINNPCVTISNVSVNGIAISSGESYGRFTDGGSNFPFAEGIILSTGRVASAPGPNSSILSEGSTTWAGDADLETALNVGGSINATILEFDFLPFANKISFDYIFSSEQYLTSPTQNQCNFTDGFVFLLQPANSGIPYQNLAVVPGTTIPVRINTVRGAGTICPPANEAFFGGFNGNEHPTNFNGQTVILTASASVLPGTLYHIKLVVADQGNNLYDSAIFLGANSFKIQKNLGDDRLTATGNPLCEGDILSIDATEPGTNNSYEWYKDNVLQPDNTALYSISEPGSYRVEITINGTACKITGEIEIEYNTFTLNPANIVQCDPDNDGVTIFNLRQVDGQVASGMGPVAPIYYENQADLQPIPNPQSYSSTAKTVYAKLTNAFGCAAFAPVTLQISNNALTPPPIFEICDGDAVQDGFYPFDLSTEVTPEILNTLPAGLQLNYYATESNALTQENQLSNPFSNTIPFQEIIWARIVNGPDCFGIIPITLRINAFTAPDFEDEEIRLCENAAVDLTVASGYSSYLWDDTNQNTTRTLRVTTPDTYTVKVTDSNGCEDTKKFVVLLSGIATIDAININDFKGSKNTVEIIFSGFGSYEFSLDGQTYQESALFTDVPSGAYMVYVKDKYFCGTAEEPIFVLDYPLYFTPNGDGQNDIWYIPFLQFYPSAKTVIFDRYGKIVYSFNGAGTGWTGNLNGVPLPSTDYWFLISFVDGRRIKGHFALKR